MKIGFITLLLAASGFATAVCRAEILPIYSGVDQENKCIACPSVAMPDDGSIPFKQTAANQLDDGLVKPKKQYMGYTKLEFENRHDEVLLKNLKKSITDAPGQLVYGAQLFLQGRRDGEKFVVTDWFLLSPFYEMQSVEPDKIGDGCYAGSSDGKQHLRLSEQCFIRSDRQPSAELKQALEQRTLRGKCRKLVTLDFAEGDERCYDAKNTFVASFAANPGLYSTDGLYAPKFIFKDAADAAVLAGIDSNVKGKTNLWFVQGEFRADRSFLVERWMVVEPLDLSVLNADAFKNETTLTKKLLTNDKNNQSEHGLNTRQADLRKYRAKFVSVK